MSVNDKQLGMALIVSGPSGAGKTSICQKVRHEMGDVAFSVSCTTRPPRSGEIDGKDYFFLSREQFEKKFHKTNSSNLLRFLEIIMEH